MYTGNCRSGRRYDGMFLSLKYWVLVLQKWKYWYKAYFSLTWPVAMHIHLASSYAHLLQQKKCLHKKRVQLPLRLVWTTNCFFCFGTPTGQKWNHDKSLYILKSFFFQAIAERYPDLPLSTILFAEKRFVEADLDRNGVSQMRL